MIGAIILVVALVVVIPVGFLMSTAIAAAALGHTLTEDAEARHEGSELIALTK
ncbi:MAG TPA: hypothetical protein VIL36_00955 [Acidimicrobiales bacterium]